VTLTEIFRQAATSQIIVNAHRINQGQMPLMREDRPTVSLDVISLVASSCRYYRDQIEQHAAQ